MEYQVILESCLRFLCRSPGTLSMRQVLGGVRIAPANCCAGFILQLRPSLERLLYFSFQEFSLGACHQSRFAATSGRLQAFSFGLLAMIALGIVSVFGSTAIASQPLSPS